MKPVVRANSVSDDPAERSRIGQVSLDGSEASSAPFWAEWSKMRISTLVLAKHTHGNVLFWLMALSILTITCVLEI